METEATVLNRRTFLHRS